MAELTRAAIEAMRAATESFLQDEGAAARREEYEARLAVPDSRPEPEHPLGRCPLCGEPLQQIVRELHLPPRYLHKDATIPEHQEGVPRLKVDPTLTQEQRTKLLTEEQREKLALITPDGGPRYAIKQHNQPLISKTFKPDTAGMPGLPSDTCADPSCDKCKGQRHVRRAFSLQEAYAMGREEAAELIRTWGPHLAARFDDPEDILALLDVVAEIARTRDIELTPADPSEIARDGGHYRAECHGHRWTGEWRDDAVSAEADLTEHELGGCRYPRTPPGEDP